MNRLQIGSIDAYRFERFPNGDLVHAVFGRRGGVSPAPFDSLNMSVTVGDTLQNVRENRRRAFRALDLPEDDRADCWVVHGTDVLQVTENRAHDGDPVRADGLITDVPGVNLFMRYADCVPILLYDPKRYAIGLGHSGWRGTVAGSTQRLVQAMVQAFGSNPADIIAGIGPSIGPDSYEVGSEVVEAARAAFPDAPEVILPINGKTHFDLWRANEIALRREGVQQIELPGHDTATETAAFFSHRGDGGRSGRFGAVIALRP